MKKFFKDRYCKQSYYSEFYNQQIPNEYLEYAKTSKTVEIFLNIGSYIVGKYFYYNNYKCYNIGYCKLFVILLESNL